MPGGLGQADISNSMRAYAASAAEDAFWLDWLDGVLFAENNEKTLGFINYTNGVPLTIEHANDSLKRIPGCEDAKEEVHAVPRNGDSWLVLSCNVQYDPHGPTNHWLPCVFKEAVAASTYAELTGQQIDSLKVQIASLESELLDVELEDEDIAEAQSVALQDQILT